MCEILPACVCLVLVEASDSLGLWLQTALSCHVGAGALNFWFLVTMLVSAQLPATPGNPKFSFGSLTLEPFPTSDHNFN